MALLLQLLRLNLLLLLEKDTSEKGDALLNIRRRMLSPLRVALSVGIAVCAYSPPSPILQKRKEESYQQQFAFLHQRNNSHRTKKRRKKNSPNNRTSHMSNHQAEHQ
jgi:hypothetical protein